MGSHNEPPWEASGKSATHVRAHGDQYRPQPDDSRVEQRILLDLLVQWLWTYITGQRGALHSALIERIDGLVPKTTTHGWRIEHWNTPPIPGSAGVEEIKSQSSSSPVQSARYVKSLPFRIVVDLDMAGLPCFEHRDSIPGFSIGWFEFNPCCAVHPAVHPVTKRLKLPFQLRLDNCSERPGGELCIGTS